MKKLFTTCLLVLDKASEMKLVQTQVELRPSLSLSPKLGESIALAGGFPSLSPETEIPLSSTLFVNYSLASPPQETLHQIAFAELQRRNSVDFRSYYQDPDNRVAVIGSEPSSLLAFLENYGGILRIEPLLAKGSHPEMPTLTELEITPLRQGCRLEYQIRTPIDLRLCSYCGACGPACPEGCINERLFLDFNRCTLCRSCEPVCPTKAIDVHGVQVRSLEAPALIVLDGLHIAETGSYLYREDDLPRYFSTLFPTRIDEVVTWNGALCQYSSKLGYGCTLCGEACQHSAITFDGSGVEIDPITCEECGECVAVCPTGALQYERCNDENFARYLDLLPNFSNTTVVIGTDEALRRLWWRAQNQHFAATFFMEFPNPRALSLFHFLNLAMHGAKNVLVLSDNAAESGSEQMMLANIFMDKLLDLKEFVSQMPPETVAANGLSNRLGPAPATADKLTFINRRLTVATALKKLVRQSKRQVSLKAKGDLPFATIHCDENRCTQCGACLNECKIGALSADMTQLSLHHNASLCVACGVCAQTCPEHALSISTSFTLGKEFFSPVQLAQAEPMTCRRCGKVFGTKKSYERVMAILASRETVDASHFAYCETCRVLNIFEEQ